MKITLALGFLVLLVASPLLAWPPPPPGGGGDAPEISAGMLAGAVVLFAGGLAVLRDKRRKK